MSAQTDNDYYQELAKVLNASYFIGYLWLVIVLGCIGNLVCFLAIQQFRGFQRKVKIWICGLLLSDTGLLLTDSLRLLIKLQFKFDIRDVNNVCQLHIFLSNSFLYASTFMQIGFSLQRLIYLVHPFWARSNLGYRRVIMAFVATNLLALPPNLVYIFTWKVIPAPGRSEFYILRVCPFTIVTQVFT